MVERRGPRVGAPQAALDGFIGVARRERLRARGAGRPEGPGARRPLPARRQADARGAGRRCSAPILARFPWPKSMRWGDHEIRWIRPLRSILCLFDGEVVPVEFGPLRAGATTRGHRFLAPAPIEVRDFEDYRQKLAAAYVQLDGAERQRDDRERGGPAGARGGAAPARRSGAARRARRPGRVAGRPARPDRPAVHGAAGGSPGHGDAPSPEVPGARGRRRSPGAALRRRRQSPGQGRRPGHRRGQRARAARAAVGRPVLLGSGPQAAARQPGARSSMASCSTPASARSAPRRRASRSWPAGSRSACPGPRPSSRPGQGCCARPIWSPAWSASSRSSRASWAGTTRCMIGSSPRSPPRSPSTTRRRARATRARARRSASPWRSPTSSTRLVGFFAIGEKPTGSKDPFALRRAALGAIRLILENRLRLPLQRRLRAGPGRLRRSAARGRRRCGERGAAGLLRRPAARCT